MVTRRSFISLSGLGGLYLAAFGLPSIPRVGDDSGWIQAQIDAASDVLTLKPGFYTIGRSIVVPAGLSIVGHGVTLASYGEDDQIIKWMNPGPGDSLSGFRLDARAVGPERAEWFAAVRVERPHPQSFLSDIYAECPGGSGMAVRR